MALIIPTYWKAIDAVSPAMAAMRKSTMSYAQKTNAAFQIADRAISKHLSILSHAQKELVSGLGAAAIAYKAVQSIEYGFEAVKNFDESVTKLQTNFRLSDAAMIPFKKQIMSVADASYKAANDVSEVFNIIGSKNRDLVSQPGAIAAMAKSSITLSEALKTQMIPTAEGLTGIMAGWKLTDSAKAMDVLAGASSSGSVQGLALMEALKGISQEAHHANLSLGQTAAMMEYIDKSAQDGGASATAFMRTILKLEALPAARGYRNAGGQFNINSAIAGIQKQLAGKAPMVQELILKDMFKITTPKQVIAARALIEPGSLGKIMAYQKQTELVGIAEQMAAKNTGTLAVAMERVKVSFANAFIASDTVGTGMNNLKNVLVFVYEHMNTILNVAIKLIEVFALWKIGVMAVRAATILWDIAIGINSALIGESAFVTELATVQYAAFRATVVATTASQWLLNAAMDANPIGLVVIAIVGLTVAIYEVYKHWDEITKAFTNPSWAIKTGGLAAGLGLEFKHLYNSVNATGQALAAIGTGIFTAEAKVHWDLASIAVDANRKLNQQERDIHTPINSKVVAYNSYIENSLLNNPMQRIGIDINTGYGLNANVTDNKNSIPVTTTSTHANGFKN